MKLRKDDLVMVIAGRDKGKTGKVVAALPQEDMVVVENVNVAKRHTKPDSKNPRGGILEIAKPISSSKVMVIDPVSNQPARIGYKTLPDGSKERVYKVSANRKSKAKATKAPAKKASGDKK